MLHTVADILKEFIKREVQALSEYALVHAPTIGKMYEGLTHKLLERTIPSDLELKVVSGFIEYNGNLSPQIDCMLVHGAGSLIPHTSEYKWPASHVIAVLEVKKSLIGEEFNDAYKKLSAVEELCASQIQDNGDSDVALNTSLPLRNFAKVTGVKPPSYNKLSSMPFHLQMIYHVLVTEHFSPLRIVIGYNGPSKEKTLRDWLGNLINEKYVKASRMTISSLPNLVISDEHALVKSVGTPYIMVMDDDYWPVYFSTRNNSMIALVEMLWHKIETQLSVAIDYENDKMEIGGTPYLFAKAIESDGGSGWIYRTHELRESDLIQCGGLEVWQPIILTDVQHTVIVKLTQHGSVPIDEELASFATSTGQDINELVQSLVDTRLVARDSDRLYLTTESLAVMMVPGVGTVAAENNRGQLLDWLMRRMNSQ